MQGPLSYMTCGRISGLSSIVPLLSHLHCLLTSIHIRSIVCSDKNTMFNAVNTEAQVSLSIERTDAIKYWEETAWKKARGGSGGSSLSSDDVRQFDFLEDSNGSPLSAARLRQLRKLAGQCYRELANRADVYGGRIHHWSGDANVRQVEFMKAQLYPSFPEFRLCESDWKLQQFLIQHYPSWYKNNKQAVAIKPEDTSPATTPSPEGKIPAKRPAADGAEAAIKKPAIKRPKLSLINPLYVTIFASSAHFGCCLM